MATEKIPFKEHGVKKTKCLIFTLLTLFHLDPFVLHNAGTCERPFFKKKKIWIFLSSFGSLRVMDVSVCASLLLCSLTLPHLLFPHKNSYWWKGEASEGWVWGCAEGLLVRFVLNPCLERKLSLPDDLRAVGLPGELVCFSACNNPPSEHKTYVSPLCCVYPV